MPLQTRVPDTSVIGPVYYLHGFASSARSTKAMYFAERLRECGLTLRIPDFNEPDFASMTMTRMLDQLNDDIARTPSPSDGSIVLVGSSLGAVVAVLTAARMPERIWRLVLLAPALTFPKSARFLGPERVSQWRATGTLEVFHFGDGVPRLLNYSFYEDSLKYDAFSVLFEQPTLVFQGLRDEALDYRDVERYAAGKPNIKLSLLDDDHQLTSSLPRIWSGTASFLGLT